MKIFVFGNPLVKKDSLPLKLIKPLSERFPRIGFIELDPNENLEDLGKNPVILDTVIGIKEVKIIKNLDSVQPSPRFSMHDFDLGTNLKLLKKIGKIESVIIIGIPDKIKQKEAMKQLETVIRKL